MPRLPIVGSDSKNWGIILNKYLKVSHRENGLLKTTMQVFNVKDYGAAGNGNNDDTKAIRKTISAAQSSSNGGTIYFPSGEYLVTGTLLFTTQKIVEIRGNGWSSNIKWAFNGHLFKWTSEISCREITMGDLKITSVIVSKSAGNAAVLCAGGVERSYFDHLLIAPGNLGNPTTETKPGSGIIFTGVSDSTTIHQCQFWGIKGTGIKIGRGSEIRIEGGRIIGVGTRNDSSIGVHLTGNNGGVHILTTDIIGLHEGVRIENLGAGSNREVMLTHSTLDSCWRGLQLQDQTYVSIIGCWAASCDQDNIHVEPDAGTPLLVISGGTIFNAGVYDREHKTLAANGIVVNSGSFMLTGVSVRNNKGKGIWVSNSNVKDYMITGCRITNNGQGADLKGSHYLITNNIFSGNGTANKIEGSNYLNNNNITH